MEKSSLPQRQAKPAAGCNASQEALLNKKKNPLDVDEDCPICRDSFGVLCQVGCHPSSNSGDLLLVSRFL